MTDDRRTMLLAEYAEVSSNFRLLTDIRFKLLAFLPLVAGAAAAVVARGAPAVSALAFSLFGLVVTLGLVTYNARNDQLYNTLISRAAAIERHLDDPDGAFANRPRAWLRLKTLGWQVDHGTGVATIYYASVALWLFGVTNSIAQIGHNLIVGGLIPLWVRLTAIGAAVAVTATGAALIKWRKKTIEAGLRQRARHAVTAVIGKRFGELADNADVRATLTGLAGKDVGARLRYLARLAPEDVAFFINLNAGEWTAAQTVAYITDFPPEWLYDCLTSRRVDVE